MGSVEAGANGLRKLSIYVKGYDPKFGVVSWWEPDSRLIVRSVEFGFGQEIEISGNKAGLISLARDLLTLAQDETPGDRNVVLDAVDLDGESKTVRMTKIEPWES